MRELLFTAPMDSMKEFKVYSDDSLGSELILEINNGRLVQTCEGYFLGNSFHINKVIDVDYTEDAWKDFLAFCQTGKHPG